MEALIQNIQASRNVANPTLYLGGLQLNYDQYFSANDLHNQNMVPRAPAKIFTNYGATAEIDNRPFASLGLQVPRNPEQEALNEYFNQERVRKFAKGQSSFLISEQLAKQSELLANQFVADEMDRRAGIRRAVLEATGLTPAQVQQQIATETLAGINPRLVDVRDRQVQDAVNLYYNQNNIPLPVTTLAEPTTNMAPTVPQEARNGLPITDAEAGAVEDQAVLTNTQDGEDEFDTDGANARLQEMMARFNYSSAFKPEDMSVSGGGSVTGLETNTMASSTSVTTDPRARSYAGSLIDPNTLGGYDPALVERLERMSKSELVNEIVGRRIKIEGETVDSNNRFYEGSTMMAKMTAPRMRTIILDSDRASSGLSNASANASSLQKY